MIAIIKYNAGNISSVQNALDRAGFESVVTDDPSALTTAGKVIFPGVGEAASAMKYLKERGLDEVIPVLKQPVLGICLGLQLMCNYSEEGDTECMRIFNTSVKRFPPLDIIPHTGWNNFSKVKGPLFKGVDNDSSVYYVHSFYADVCDDTVAICNYLKPFSAALQKGNFYGTQFHPEKSGMVGEKILLNFLTL